jgi:HEAT repeat protein
MASRFFDNSSIIGRTRLQEHLDRSLSEGNAMLPAIRSAIAIALLGFVAACACGDEKKEARYFGKTVAAWAAQLKSKDPSERLEAVGNLGLIGADAKSAIPDLVEVARDKEGTIAMFATNVLGWFGPAGIPALIELLVDENKEVRRQAARAVAGMGPTANSAVDTLVECLKDEDKVLRQLAAHALGTIGAGAESAVPILANALESDVREWAAEALCKLGPHAKGAVPTLVKLLYDVEPESRALAARILKEIGPDAKEAVPGLLDTLKDVREVPTTSGSGFGGGGGFGRAVHRTPVARIVGEALKDIDPEAAKKAGIK